MQSLLQEKHILKNQAEATEHLSAVLQSIIEELLGDMESKDALRSAYSIPRCVLEHISQHIGFCQKAASCSVNRESALTAIKRYQYQSFSVHCTK